MPKRMLTPALATLAITLTLSISVQAGATRTFVSTIGSDTNTSANCSPAAPCRTFAAALSVTNSGGEIVVLTSGGYGPATITQSVIIIAIGVDASISQPTFGQNAITINTSGNVTLIGLNLHGEGSGAAGVLVTQVGFLRLYNMLIENFVSYGVGFDAGGDLEISGSSMNDNQGNGLTVFPNASANAYVRNTSFSGSMAGVAVLGGHVTVADSSAEFNSIGFYSEPGTLMLENDRVMFNNVGLAAVGNLYFANCFIANNTYWYNIDTGTIAGTNPGTSFIAPGQITSGGALSTPITLQ